MEQATYLMAFFKAIANEPIIGASHISLYCALLKDFEENGGTSPLPIMRNDLMKAAKIFGKATFHKCISDLHSLGYIKYQPSHNHRKKSKVFFAFQQTIQYNHKK